MNQEKRTRKKPLPLDVSVPRSVNRSAKAVTFLLVAFLGGLVYLGWTLVRESPMYMAKSGRGKYGIVYDRHGDVLYDGTNAPESYPAGQFADVGNLIGDDKKYMTNTFVQKHLMELVNYSFSSEGVGQVALTTTLDHQANKAVYDALGKKNGTVIACNWKTGEVLVCVSKPCVDITKGYGDIEKMENGSLLCKAFYPIVPGSTQKVSTLIAAYEKLGVDTVNEMQFDCTGSWLNASGQRINCHDSKGHGTQLLAEAFAHSCNPYFAQLVQSEKLPLSAIIETYTRMGYAVNGAKADALSLDGITIAPASTTLTDAKDFDTQWGCLGQGETLVSPYQLMLWQTAIASGTGRATVPYLLASRTNFYGKVEQIGKTAQTKQMFTWSAAKAVQDVMVENSTKHYYVSLPDFQCGVKSGTAQVEQDGKKYENSLLAGFCLDEDCPVAFCIVIEERVSNDTTTAQIAKKLLHALSGR